MGLQNLIGLPWMKRGINCFLPKHLGLSPEVLTRDVIEDRLANNFELSKNSEVVTHVYFYGAGCGTDRMKNFLAEIFSTFFPNAQTDVQGRHLCRRLRDHQTRGSWHCLYSGNWV